MDSRSRDRIVDELRKLATHYQVGCLDAGELRRACVRLLEEDADESLIGISNCDGSDDLCIVSAWASVKAAYGIEEMADDIALEAYVRDVAASIISGTVAPGTGADLIADAVAAVGDPTDHEYDTFLYASSELQERPNERALFEGGIREAAVALLSGNSKPAS